MAFLVVEVTSYAEVVKWQTRTFEGRVAQAVRVQVPPSAPILSRLVLTPCWPGSSYVMAREHFFVAYSIYP